MAPRNHSGSAMMQAEVGGGARIDVDRRLQRPGYTVRDFIANRVDGRRIQISDYCGHANLVLVFAGNLRAPMSSWQDLRSRSCNSQNRSRCSFWFFHPPRQN